MKELTRSGEDPSICTENCQPPSIPVYHASIVQIEQHEDDRNQSDLIVRVPNFHHVSMPSVTITINETRVDQREGSIKRRAPICPIITGMNEQNKSANPKRFTVGLKNFRRAIVTNFRVKPSTNANQITLVPVLPDVEVIRGEFDTTPSEKKTRKQSGSTSKFFVPKILLIKRKYFKMNKKRQSSGSSAQAQPDRTNDNSRAYFHVKIDESDGQDNPINQSDHEDKNTSFVSDHEQSSNMIKDPDIRPPEIFISNSTIDLITDRSTTDHKEEEGDSEGRIYIVDSDGDTYSECYEVTYEFDPEFQRFIDQHKERIDLPAVRGKVRWKSKELICISLLDLSEYEDNPPSLPIPPPPSSNEYENIEQPSTDRDITYFKQESTSPHVKFLTIDEFLPSGPGKSVP